MARTLTETGFNAFSLTIPSSKELLQIFDIAAPVFITMTSKVFKFSIFTFLCFLNFTALFHADLLF